MLKNFKLVIEYDGSAFHGWQRQKSDRTIQGEIETALSIMLRHDVSLIGSGRTDAGVHARGQVANFKSSTTLSAKNFHHGLNSLLPSGIVIKSCDEAPLSFHARFDVTSKIYRYRILNRPVPPAIGRQYTWFIRKDLNLELMHRATANLLGQHDFKSFEASGSPRNSSVRHIMRAEFSKKKHDYLEFEIEADGFLRYMVRNIVGTLAEVGLKKISLEEFKTILFSKDRNLAGATAPPQGLFLQQVNYGPSHG